MRHTDKSWPELDSSANPFLPDEDVERAGAEAVELRNRIVKLEQQVLSQFTSMAAYATIAKRDVETARAEGRSDLDRARATLIGLLERLRNEVNGRLEGAERRTSGGEPAVDAGSRLLRLEHDFAEATSSLQQCVRENRDLRAKVASLMEHRMQEQGWLVSSGTGEALSMR